MQKSNSVFGFLGAGRMATALAGGMLQAKLIKSRALFAADVVPAAAKAFAKATGGKALRKNSDVLQKANVTYLDTEECRDNKNIGKYVSFISQIYIMISSDASQYTKFTK